MKPLYLLGNDPAMEFFAVILLVALAGFGLLMILRPDITWWFETALQSWKYAEDPEPSEGALLMQRIGGVLLILTAMFLAWKGFFEQK